MGMGMMRACTVKMTSRRIMTMRTRAKMTASNEHAGEGGGENSNHAR